MTNQHFYVENSRLMSYGLSNLGTRKTKITISSSEPIFILAGKLIGAGFHSDRIQMREQLIDYTKNKNPFIRRSAYIGLSFSGLFENSEQINKELEKGFNDSDLEVKKTALIGFGLANIGNHQLNTEVLDEHLHDKVWKIRSASGLAYSLLASGSPDFFSKFVDILKKEENPYVKVCSCWYVSNAFAGTKEGIDEYRELLAVKGDQNSFFRDMACIGLGLSYLGTSEDIVNKLLKESIKNDSHPYVRESAFLGLALCNYQNPSHKILSIMTKGITDDSMVVRSGAALSLGIITMGTKSLEMNLDDYTDPSVLWGCTLSEGLANVTPSRRTFNNSYVQWGHQISNGFRDNVSFGLGSEHRDVESFQEGFNSGLIGSGIGNKEEKDAIRLIIPGVFHYLVYDSFWWGLWVLSTLGITTFKKGRLK